MLPTFAGTRHSFTVVPPVCPSPPLPKLPSLVHLCVHSGFILCPPHAGCFSLCCGFCSCSLIKKKSLFVCLFIYSNLYPQSGGRTHDPKVESHALPTEPAGHPNYSLCVPCHPDLLPLGPAEHTREVVDGRHPWRHMWRTRKAECARMPRQTLRSADFTEV